jgi:hypothetical protein
MRRVKEGKEKESWMGRRVTLSNCFREVDNTKMGKGQDKEDYM